MAHFTYSRRRFIATTSGLLAAPALLRASRASAQEARFKIGFVAPTTGPLAGFGEGQDWILAGLKESLASVTNNGKPVEIQLVTKDSQSNPNRAAEVAQDLILNEGVQLMLTHATPDTTNPVADQCELNEVPCISTNCPWQPYFFGRGGVAETGFDYTYHFFWGLEDIIANYTAMWQASGLGRRIAGLFPNDSDGNAWGDAQRGLPGPLAAAGFALTDPGRYQPMNNDFTSQIAAFKAAGCEIVTGVMIPPDFATFWAQAAQQGFRPRMATIGKALLFPASVAALGPRGDGLTTEVWWTPDYPYASSLTGVSARDFGAAYVAQTGKPWTATLGFSHAVFEVGLDVVRRAADLSDKAAIMAAITSTDLATLVGPINWAHGPVKNVTKTPLAGGQWQREGDHLALKIVNTKANPQLPITGDLKLLA